MSIKRRPHFKHPSPGGGAASILTLVGVSGPPILTRRWGPNPRMSFLRQSINSSGNLSLFPCVDGWHPPRHLPIRCRGFKRILAAVQAGLQGGPPGPRMQGRQTPRDPGVRLAHGGSMQKYEGRCHQFSPSNFSSLATDVTLPLFQTRPTQYSGGCVTAVKPPPHCPTRPNPFSGTSHLLSPTLPTPHIKSLACTHISIFDFVV